MVGQEARMGKGGETYGSFPEEPQTNYLTG